MSIKGLKSLLMPFLAIALLAGCWLGLASYQTSQHALPSYVDTLAEFTAEMPKPEKVMAFEKGGSSYIEVVGSCPGFPTLPSGPPAYIFNSTGAIRFWTIDTGDSEEYRKSWQGRTNSREVSMQEALEMVKGVKH